MSNIIRFKVGDAIPEGLIDLTQVSIRALGRKSVSALLIEGLDHGWYRAVFEEKTFVDPKEGKAPSVLAVTISQTEHVEPATAAKRMSGATLSKDLSRLRGVGLRSSMSVIGYGAAKALLQAVATLAAPGDVIQIDTLEAEDAKPGKSGRVPKKYVVTVATNRGNKA